MRGALVLLSTSLAACVWTQDLGHDREDEPEPSDAAPDVSCLDSIVYEPPSFETTTAVVTVITDDNPAQTIPGATLRVCSDLKCTDPTYETKTAQDGLALVELPLDAQHGFLGYIEAGVASPEFLNLRHFVPRVRGQEDLVTHALTRADETAIYQAANRPLNAELGTVGVRVADCTGDSAAGLVVELDDESVEYPHIYFNQQDPDLDRTESDSFGQVLILGVSPGKHTIRSRAGDFVVGEAEILVRGGAITTLFLPPTPPLPW